jgi:hypothetical protein
MNMRFMLIDPLFEIACHADVKSTALAAHDVDVVALHADIECVMAKLVCDVRHKPPKIMSFRTALAVRDLTRA